MQILKNTKIYIFIFAFMLMRLSWAEPVNTREPMQMLQSIANNMIAELKKNRDTLKTNPRKVYALANRLVVPYADIDEMSKRVLSPETWNKMTAKQKTHFEKEFTTLLVRTYASALAAYKDQGITFFPIRGSNANKHMIEVNSEINSAGNIIRVSYRLLHKENGWRLYDMSVEGVSLLESFRSQFADLLKQGDIETLLNKMSNHNK